MPTSDYRCTEHGHFELHQRMSEHASAECPNCGTPCKQVMTAPPGLDIEAMANLGMPGAMDLCEDRLCRRHIGAGQSYVHPDKAAKYR